MGSYKPVLRAIENQYNSYYKSLNKQKPYLSKDQKNNEVIGKMMQERLECNATNFEHVQYVVEMFDLMSKFDGVLRHFFIPDYSLLEWMESTPVKESNMEYFYRKIDSFDETSNTFGIYTKNKSTVISFYNPRDSRKLLNSTTFDKDDVYVMSVLYDDTHYMALLNMLDFKKLEKQDENSAEIKAFRLAMNFLFYLDAFPDCVIDGVPNEVKKEPNSKIIKVTDKVISNSGEHYVSPHFRSGHFRHLDSDYYVNKKGSVVFIPATMVKGKAKTVLSS